MENNAAELQAEKEPKEPSFKKRFIAGSVLVLLLAGGGFFLNSAREKNIKREQEEAATQPEEETRSVSRSEIAELFPEFRFREKFPVGDREYYLALSRDQLTMIQLLGPEESLDEIIMTTFMEPKSAEKKEELAGYQKRLREKITPGLKDSDVSGLAQSGGNLEADGFEVTYDHLEYGDGHYSDSYLFKKIE